MTTEFIISEEFANKVCAILVNHGENRIANKLCSRPAPAAPGTLEEACPCLIWEDCHEGSNDYRCAIGLKTSSEKCELRKDYGKCVLAYLLETTNNQQHQPPASPDADMLLNNLLAKFMLANKRGNFRPWNIQHIQQEIEYFREELRQSRQGGDGR